MLGTHRPVKGGKEKVHVLFLFAFGLPHHWYEDWKVYEICCCCCCYLDCLRLEDNFTNFSTCQQADTHVLKLQQ